MAIVRYLSGQMSRTGEGDGEGGEEEVQETLTNSGKVAGVRNLKKRAKVKYDIRSQ